jgi:hypothetical protein
MKTLSKIIEKMAKILSSPVKAKVILNLRDNKIKKKWII